jgi:acyl-CoA synthetase (AMP-forming)/AMP-acid ligase II
MNVTQVLKDTIHRFPQKTALLFKGEEVTFEQLGEKVFSLAQALWQLGIRKGDKIAIYLPNCPQYIYSYLAIFCCGATAVPLDYMLTQEELFSCLEHCKARLLIAQSKEQVCLKEIKGQLPALEWIVAEDFLPFKQMLSTAASSFLPPKYSEKDYAVIFYTSGTTGRPKGVLITYRQLSLCPRAMEFFVDLSDKDNTLCALPFSHSGGFIYIQNMVYFGTRLILMPRFAPLEFLKNVQQYRVTCFWLVPSMYYALLQLKEFGKFDLSSLRWLVVFGAPSSSVALRRFHRYCPQASFLNGWGLTETNAPTTVTPLGSNKIESVGKPLPWCEVKIFSVEGSPLRAAGESACGEDENDQELPVGQIGEVVVRGEVVTEGYYKDPQLTSLVIRNGWFHSGDLGRFDEEGFLYIVGRIKEMIKVSGEIVLAPEVETAIHRYPGVGEVAVVAVPDKLRGEVPKAFIVMEDGRPADSDEIRHFLRRHLAHFKIPHHFEFRDNLPKNRVGKIDKELLRRHSSVLG